MPTLDQLGEFDRQGFLALHRVLDPATLLDPIVAEYDTVLDRLARHLVAAGELPEPYDDLEFAPRFMRIVAETGQTFSQWFDPALPQGDVSTDTPLWTGPAIFRLLTSDALLDVVESVIGPEIYANPVQHVRIKPPERLVARELATGQHALAATSWHQDNGVVTPDADGSEILTVWIPLTRASTRHGCLTVIPGSHRGDLYTHCPGSPAGLEIPESVLGRDRAVPVPLDRGDVLLLHRRTAHASLSNTSDEIRWSLDLRFNPTGQPTGRSVHPGFVARSRSRPASELRDAGQWSALWEDARARLAVDSTFAYNRWDSDAPACA
ncbi:MAG TPA: phytanoyl-CoA dioxygenase family protein [Acidimicrobiia bacterium]|nr:phytanoyl-CoA dioxygenase family protein [Acidimicrobiia bacterium]